MSDRLADITYWAVVSHQSVHPSVSFPKSDFDWLIEKVEEQQKEIENLQQYKKVLMENSIVRSKTIERYEKALKWIVENFDSDKSGLSDEEYHKEMMKKANESLKC
jgi:hypothetical protein